GNDMRFTSMSPQQHECESHAAASALPGPGRRHPGPGGGTRGTGGIRGTGGTRGTGGIRGTGRGGGTGCPVPGQRAGNTGGRASPAPQDLTIYRRSPLGLGPESAWGPLGRDGQTRPV